MIMFPRDWDKGKMPIHWFGPLLGGLGLFVVENNMLGWLWCNIRHEGEVGRSTCDDQCSKKHARHAFFGSLGLIHSSIIDIVLLRHWWAFGKVWALVCFNFHSFHQLTRVLMPSLKDRELGINSLILSRLFLFEWCSLNLTLSLF